MGRNYPEDAVIFIASLFSSHEVFDAVAAKLQDLYGRIYYQSPSLPWNYSTYYEAEMGTPLYRRFLFFENVVDPISLVEAKHAAQKIENGSSVDRKRRINLDPGYMSLAKVVLSSKKNYSHRIYLGRGVFCELELFYQEGRFNPLPYTYYDYRDDIVLKLFGDARLLFKKRLEAKKNGAGTILTTEDL